MNIKLMEPQLSLMAQRFKTLSDPMRLRVVALLMEGEKNVNQLVSLTHSSQPNISKHLRVLKEQGMVSRKQLGTQALFSVSADYVEQLCDILIEEMPPATEQQKVFVG